MYKPVSVLYLKFPKVLGSVSDLIDMLGEMGANIWVEPIGKCYYEVSLLHVHHYRSN
jgi:hypothetical protein